jgi:hypothetical protein
MDEDVYILMMSMQQQDDIDGLWIKMVAGRYNSFVLMI